MNVIGYCQFHVTSIRLSGAAASFWPAGECGRPINVGSVSGASAGRGARACYRGHLCAEHTVTSGRVILHYVDGHLLIKHPMHDRAALRSANNISNGNKKEKNLCTSFRCTISIKIPTRHSFRQLPLSQHLLSRAHQTKKPSPKVHHTVGGAAPLFTAPPRDGEGGQFYLDLVRPFHSYQNILNFCCISCRTNA